MTQLPAPQPIPDKKPNDKLPDQDLSHRWVGNAQIDLDYKTAKAAAFRGSFRAKVDMRIDVLDVMCLNCRRNMEDVADRPCAAKIDNRHLIGGDQREREKRKKVNLPPGAVVVAGPRINRRGIDAYIRGEI